MSVPIPQLAIRKDEQEASGNEQDGVENGGGGGGIVKRHSSGNERAGPEPTYSRVPTARTPDASTHSRSIVTHCH